MKTLYLVRHAKSSWADSTLADEARPLNKRGLRDAPMMGHRLAARHVPVDAVWTSPAVRAVETARYFARALKFPGKKVKQRDRLYTDDITDILQELQACPDKVATLLLVGHNPVITELADFLLAGDPEADVGSIPTCGIVALDFICPSWQQIGEKNGRLVFFDYPKNDVVPF